MRWPGGLHARGWVVTHQGLLRVAIRACILGCWDAAAGNCAANAHSHRRVALPVAAARWIAALNPRAVVQRVPTRTAARSSRARPVTGALVRAAGRLATLSAREGMTSAGPMRVARVPCPSTARGKCKSLWTCHMCRRRCKIARPRSQGMRSLSSQHQSSLGGNSAAPRSGHTQAVQLRDKKASQRTQVLASLHVPRPLHPFGHALSLQMCHDGGQLIVPTNPVPAAPASTTPPSVGQVTVPPLSC